MSVPINFAIYNKNVQLLIHGPNNGQNNDNNKINKKCPRQIPHLLIIDCFIEHQLVRESSKYPTEWSDN